MFDIFTHYKYSKLDKFIQAEYKSLADREFVTYFLNKFKQLPTDKEINYVNKTN